MPKSENKVIFIHNAFDATIYCHDGNCMMGCSKGVLILMNFFFYQLSKVAFVFGCLYRRFLNGYRYLKNGILLSGLYEEVIFVDIVFVIW